MEEFILISDFAYALTLGYFAIELMSKVFRQIQFSRNNNLSSHSDISIGVMHPLMLRNAKILSLKIEHRTSHHCAIYQGDASSVEKALRHQECKIAIFYETKWKNPTNVYQMLERIDGNTHVFVYYRNDLDPVIISILKECVQTNSSLFKTQRFLQQPF